MTEKELFQEALKWREHISMLANYYNDQESLRKRLETFDWLIKQAERVQKLEKELDEALDIGLKMEGDAIEWERKAKRYKQALEFYANEETYETKFATDTDEIYDPFTLIELDKGKKAREALEGKENAVNSKIRD